MRGLIACPLKTPSRGNKHAIPGDTTGDTKIDKNAGLANSEALNIKASSSGDTLVKTQRNRSTPTVVFHWHLGQYPFFSNRFVSGSLVPEKAPAEI
jgi:hypothetical protein